jgi:hypothetical protein
MTHEITKLVKYSPRRECIFRELQGEMAPGNPGVRVLCPTRWTVRADSMQSIIQNYSVLQELWDKAVEIVRDTIARIRVASQMHSFDFFFGLVLGESLLHNTDNLSRTLRIFQQLKGNLPWSRQNELSWVLEMMTVLTYFGRK